MELEFTDHGNWGAPFYELYVELGPHPGSLPSFEPAWTALWSHPTLDGPYGDGSRPISAQSPVPVARYVSDDAPHMLGTATLSDGNGTPCGCIAHIPNLASALSLSNDVDEGLNIDYGPNPLEPGEDAFTFYVPFPALDRLCGVDWQDESLPDDVVRMLDEWLARMAVAIYEVVPYSFAAIGPEGSYDRGRIREGEIPAGRGALILHAHVEGDLLHWHRPTY